MLKHRIDTEQFNATSAAGRAKVFERLSAYVSAVRSELQTGPVSSELPLAFDDLVSSLEQTFNAARGGRPGGQASGHERERETSALALALEAALPADDEGTVDVSGAAATAAAARTPAMCMYI